MQGGLERVLSFARTELSGVGSGVALEIFAEKELNFLMLILIHLQLISFVARGLNFSFVVVCKLRQFLLKPTVVLEDVGLF